MNLERPPNRPAHRVGILPWLASGGKHMPPARADAEREAPRELPKGRALPPPNADSVKSRLAMDLGYVYQPIANIHNGVVFGYAALLRGYERFGFQHPGALFETAAKDHWLPELEALLRTKAIAGFARIAHAKQTRLVLTVDARALTPNSPLEATTDAELARANLPPTCLCYKLQRATPCNALPQVVADLDDLRQSRRPIAVEDIGMGWGGIAAFYTKPPDLIEIDRFLIADLTNDHKKRVFAANLVQLAHTVAIQVLAAGVDCEAELLACRDIGCDLARGSLIAEPAAEPEDLQPTVYSHLPKLIGRFRRRWDRDYDLIRASIEAIPSLHIDDSPLDAFTLFRNHHERSFFPVIDRTGKPLGLLQETTIRAYTYSKYGRELLANKRYRKQMADFVTFCPCADVDSTVEYLLMTYNQADHPLGVIITKNFNYLGFLSQGALLKIIERKNLASARDQNPLTRLPGNQSILEYVEGTLAQCMQSVLLVYFDFDHFKPFNDTYGFRIGDRAIILFAELLRKALTGQQHFIGHIGGDDFFAGFLGVAEDAAIATVRGLIGQFAHEAQSLYDPESRQRGYIEGVDRAGQPARFPLLRCSAAVVSLPEGVAAPDADELSGIIARLKSVAKKSPEGLAIQRLEAPLVSSRAAPLCCPTTTRNTAPPIS